MKRKKKSSRGANWMDTYGDMVTLLLCFFVLLYSMSSISEEKWKEVVMSFNPYAVDTPTATPGGDGPSADGNEGGLSEEQIQEHVDKVMDDLYNKISELAAQDQNGNNISVYKDGGKVFIEFNQGIFFDGDSAYLRPESRDVLDSVCGIFDQCKDAIEEVRVVGHTSQATADRPNNVEEDRMLSSQRATNVVIYIQEHGTIDPGRLVSEGVGQWRPVASNKTEESREKNRRVEIIVSGKNIEDQLGDSVNQYVTD